MHINRITTFPHGSKQIYYKLVKREVETVKKRKKDVSNFSTVLNGRTQKRREKYVQIKFKAEWAQRGGKKSNKNYMA